MALAFVVARRSAAIACLLGVAGFGGCAAQSAPPRAQSVPVAALTIPPLGPVAAPETDGGARIRVRAVDPRRPGDPVQVEWNGQWYPAVLLSPREGGWLVHYEGYDESWDEVASEERIREP